jgi:catechol 2,3-dioxygenase-like lactoylglutathione lyase family enzyme
MEHLIRGVDHVQVAAPPGGETRARWFYGEVLGMPEIPKPEPLRSRGGVWFQCGEHQFTPDDVLPGTARIYVNDPFGNRLEFLES